jgi:hypothetical protein
MRFFLIAALLMGCNETQPEDLARRYAHDIEHAQALSASCIWWHGSKYLCEVRTETRTLTLFCSTSEGDHSACIAAPANALIQPFPSR